jgi:hypothetical protein
MLRSVFLPNQQIEVDVKFNQLQSKVKTLKISLWLNLVIKSIIAKKVVHTIDQEIGFEILTQKEIN